MRYNEETGRLINFYNNMAEVEAYCVKCKAKRQMNEPKEVSFAGKGGQERAAMQGTCPVCGTKMFRILGKKG
ncbi:hypothetical protein A2852_02100 [Candidatus Adlerbacteria bacterium RIFCSPHIGHO2_01_FULL_54_23]|nr:MAG: hypothetical protein A2852_02100 [Candidatus Adlerbacteria bacterium RIFCSPHIGHO2_01_FULL_54_23]